MTDRPESRLIPMHSPSCTRRMQAAPLLRRIRRNRFWLLLYLWLSLTLPGLILCHCCGFSSRLWVVPLFAIAPALTVFLLCTAIPAPEVNYAISLACSGYALLFCGSQLIHYRLFGRLFSLRSLWELDRMYRFGTLIRETCAQSLPQLLGMAVPLLFLGTLGRQLFSFRPLKRWQQHIPMACTCLISYLVMFLSLPLFSAPQETELQILPEAPVTESIASESPTPIFLSQDFSPNQLDLDFSGDMDRESIAQIHRYFSSRSPSRKNEKTGLFHGCNLIQISASVSGKQQISEDQTPALHRMSREGFFLTHYHGYSRNLSPFDGDYALLTGIIPSGGSGSPEAAVNNHMPLTMAQQLIPKGYTAWSLHCCHDDACTDSRYLKALGYECSISSLQPREAFDRWIGSLTSHEPFAAFCSLDTDCEASELDGILTLLLTRLEHAHMLENTLLVLTLEYDDRDLCILWKPGTHPETIDAPTGPMDLLPTLSNLFGLAFDSRLYLGRDIFGNGTPLVVLPEGSWLTELATYDTSTGKMTLRTDDLLPDGYIDGIHREVQNRIAVSALILQEDYWRVLFPIS